jgi:hypothetical protein
MLRFSVSRGIRRFSFIQMNEKLRYIKHPEKSLDANQYWRAGRGSIYTQGHIEMWLSKVTRGLNHVCSRRNSNCIFGREYDRINGGGSSFGLY